MDFPRLLTRAFTALLLLVSATTWAATDQEVLNAIKTNSADASTLIAAHAANQGKTVAEVVGELVAKDPQAAAAIVSAPGQRIAITNAASHTASNTSNTSLTSSLSNTVGSGSSGGSGM